MSIPVNRLTTVSLAALILLACSVTAHAEGDAQQGKVKADLCLGCHGVATMSNAYPTYSVPRLGGQNYEYIIVALRSYRAGTRAHPTMRGNAANLSDEDIADIAAFFSQSQPPGR
ncbi:MAG: cytochrome c [Gammaproteobacteria bacterium]|nr:cytochrome c [Gammaproteobacteria bacterium]